MPREEIAIDSEFINLQQFLKWASAVGSGGEAKMVIKEGLVQVNGAVETRLRKKLYAGDKVTFADTVYTIVVHDDNQKN